MRTHPDASRPLIGSPPLLQFGMLREIPHGVSTRLGGVSPAPFDSLNVSLSTGDAPANVHENRRRVFEAAVPAMEVFPARLVHGNDVAVFRASERADWPVESSDGVRAVEPADGIVSEVPGLAFFMTFADCVPLLFLDRKRGVVGAAHAGWRGTAAGVAVAVVEAMMQAFGSATEDIVAGIGPSIGPCCYTVGAEVAGAFMARGQSGCLCEDGPAYRLDLWAANEEQVRSSGVPAANIEQAWVCTSCSVDTYFSHRAEHGRTGRFGACIGLPA